MFNLRFWDLFGNTCYGVISCTYSLFKSYGNSLQGLSCPFLLGLALGLYPRRYWSTHEFPRVFLHKSRLRCWPLVFIYLMQLLSYMLWMKNVQWHAHWKVKVDFKCSKEPIQFMIFSCILGGGIYHINSKSSIYIHDSIFKHIFSVHTFVFLYKPLVFRGFNFIMTHERHLGFQWRVQPHGVAFI